MRSSKVLIVGSILLILLAACSDDQGSDGATTPTETATEATESPSETPEPTESPEEEPTETDGPSGETEVEAEDSSLGTILTDSDGNTLYVFLNDTDGESTCYDDCASSWPAFVVQGELQARGGVDASLLGTTERTDGEMQATYGGQPLYYFAGDEAPGDTNGQGVGEVWYVVSSEGEPIQA